MLNPRPETQDTPNGLSFGSVIRKQAAVIVTLLLFTAGAFALYRILAPLNLRDVLASLRTTPDSVYVKAIVATVLGYMALVGYDWSALRYIGKRLPLPTIALGGFLGYALGNTIGLSAVSGGAVRYRIYSALGLNAYDVLAIATFAAVSYGIGATMIGLGALALHPAALMGISSIAPTTLQLWSVLALAGITITLVGLALRGEVLRWGQFSLKAPSVSNLGFQLTFTLIEIFMAALVLQILLPPGSITYANLLVIYAIATMVGIASHVPGGVGVFESVVLSALPASVPLADAVTGLLLFRMIYFILPFLIALAGLSAVEVWAATGRSSPALARLSPVLDAARRFIPTATGFMVLATGLFMMFAGLLPNPTETANELETVLPLAMIEGGALVSSILGAMLVVVSISIFRRAQQAYWVVIGALAAGVLIATFRLQDVERVILLTVILIILLPCRVEFHRTARIAQGLWSVQWAGMIVAVLAAMLMTYFLVHENAAPSHTMWWQFGEDAPALTAGRAGVAAAVVLSLALLYSALGIGRIRMRDPDPAALAEAEGIILSAGSSGDVLALTGDKMLMFSAAGDAVLSYAIKGASWIALGAPVGSAAGREELAWAFHDAARAAGARPVFYETPESFSGTVSDLGLTRHKMGEEAVVRLPEFTLDGPDRKRLRTSYNRALRDGLMLELLAPPHSADLIETLRGISDGWMTTHQAREKRFSVGRFDPAWLQRSRIAVVKVQDRIVAFANVLEVDTTHSATVDLMRHDDTAPPNTMEYLFTALMLRLHDEGLAEFSLGMVPFAGLDDANGNDVWSRFGRLVYRHGDRFYSFAGLRQFKDKFGPEWRPRYLCCRSVLPPVAALADAARLIAGSARGIFTK